MTMTRDEMLARIEHLTTSVAELSRRVGLLASRSPAASANGYRATASANGYMGTASANGYRATASANGYMGTASANGYMGTASANGDMGTASANGDSAAIAVGSNGYVRAAKGGAMVCAERDAYWSLIGWAFGVAGKDGIKPDQWYTAKGGKLVEADDANTRAADEKIAAAMAIKVQPAQVGGVA
jgi:hypothetical protein